MTLMIVLSPHEQETLHGYLMRLASGNLLPSVDSLLKPTRIKPRQAYTLVQLEKIAAEFGLNLGALTIRNPAPGHTEPLLNQRFQRAQSSPVCPLCLGAQPYLKMAWSHDLLTACTEHGTRLIDQCPNCSTPLSLQRGKVDLCENCGFHLACAPSVPADESELAISALLSSTVHPARRLLPGELGHGQAPSTIGEFLCFLAAHIQPGAEGQEKSRKVPKPTSLQESRAVVDRLWMVLGIWPQTLQQLVIANIESGTGPGLKKRLGSWYGMLHKEFADPAYSFFREELTSIIVQNFDGHINLRLRTLSPATQDEKAWLSAAEAARFLGVGEQILATLVINSEIEGRVHVVGKNRYVAVERTVIEQLASVRRAHLSATDARKRLGVSKVFFERFIQAGALKRLAKVDRPPLVTGEYRLEDVDAVISLLIKQTLHIAIPPEQTVGILDISGKHGVSNDRVCSILQDILHGVLRPVALVSGMPGISGLRFNRRDIHERLDEVQRDPVLLITDLVRISGWKHESIKAWIEVGFLKAVQEKRGTRLVTVIPVSSLIRFMSQYAVLADLARRANSKSNWILESLRPAKIHAAVAPVTGTGVTRGVLLSVDELLKGAQLRTLPLFADIADAFCAAPSQAA